MKRTILLTIPILLSISAFGQHAQSSGVQSADLALANVLEVSLVGNTSTVNIQFNSLNDMVNGMETSTQEVRVRSNKKFKVTVQPSSNNMSYNGNSLLGTLLRVSSVMKIMVVDNHTGGSQTMLSQVAGWQAFSALGLPVTLLTNCQPGGNQTFSVKYKATPGISCNAGTYTTEMVYTATQQ